MVCGLLVASGVVADFNSRGTLAFASGNVLEDAVHSRRQFAGLLRAICWSWHQREVTGRTLP